jgi:hypothetical protein
MERKKIAALFAILLILSSLLYSSCAVTGSAAQVQSPATAEASLIVIDSSGNALPIVYFFSREDNGVTYYFDASGKELTREEILSSLESQGMTVRYVSDIWGTSIAEVFSLFTSEQLYERNSRGAAINAALLYDLWDCLTDGPPEIRENPRAILEGLVPNITMRPIVFDFLEQRKEAYSGY